MAHRRKPLCVPVVGWGQTITATGNGGGAGAKIEAMIEQVSLWWGLLQTYWAMVGQALRLQPDVFAQIQEMTGGLLLALLVVLMAGVSEAAAQSIVLFLNHVRFKRFGLALCMSLFSHFGGYLLWTTTIWLAGNALFAQNQPFHDVAAVVGLAYAPQLFSCLVLMPFLGNGIGIVLSLWSMLAVVVAVRAGFGIDTWQAVLLAAIGWMLVQLVRRTIGRPVRRIEQWLTSHVAGVPLVVQPKDVRAMRRRPAEHGYLQREVWRRRSRSSDEPARGAAPAAASSVAPPSGAQANVQ